MKSVAIVGVGAVGGAVAADLGDTGRLRLTLCTRTPFEDLSVEHPAGTSSPSMRLAGDPSDVAVVDWVFVATKTYQCASPDGHQLAPWLDRLCGGQTRIAVLQNGLDHAASVEPWSGRVLGVVPVIVELPAERLSPGRVRQRRDGRLIVGESESARVFASLFEGARTSVEIDPDFVTRAWRKLLVNAALGGVCALTLRENGVANDPDVRSLVLSVMREVAAVGRMEGASLPEDVPEAVLDEVLRKASEGWSSIVVDRREGRPMEWSARNAVVTRLARKHAVETPLNDAIVAMLRVSNLKRDQ